MVFVSCIPEIKWNELQQYCYSLYDVKSVDLPITTLGIKFLLTTSGKDPKNSADVLYKLSSGFILHYFQINR